MTENPISSALLRAWGLQWTEYLNDLADQECWRLERPLPQAWRHSFSGYFEDDNENAVGESIISVGIDARGGKIGPSVMFFARYDLRNWREVWNAKL